MRLWLTCYCTEKKTERSSEAQHEKEKIELPAEEKQNVELPPED